MSNMLQRSLDLTTRMDLTFTPNLSFQLLFIIIIGGLGSIVGAFFGAAVLHLLPIALRALPSLIGLQVRSATVEQLTFMLTGALIAVSHVDVIPPKKDDGIAALKTLADPTRKDNGNIRFDVYQQKSRPNHFTVVEVWRDQKGAESHETAPHTKQFRQVLGAATGALYDQRWYRAL